MDNNSARYVNFIADLTRLSKKYGILIRVTGDGSTWANWRSGFPPDAPFPG